MRRVAGAAVLLAWWFALWERITPANAVGGAVVVALALAASPPAGRGAAPAIRGVRRVIELLATVFWELARANVRVAGDALRGRGFALPDAVLEVPAPGSVAVTTVAANVISLLPGTVVLEARPGTAGRLVVHVLHAEDHDAARRDLKRIVERVAGALGAA